MKHALVAIALLLAATAPGFAQGGLSPQEYAAVAPVLEAMEAAVKADAALPPAASVRERLKRLGRLDQAGRMQVQNINPAGLTPEQTRNAMSAMARRMEEIDARNLAELLTLVPPEGWFSISAYGEEAADAAFHIVQHSDLPTLKRFLPAIEAMALKGEADGMNAMSMADRIAMNEKRPQRYGTQFYCVNGRREPYPLEDAARVEEWRAAMKADITYADYIAKVLPNAQKIPCRGG